jgi:hypothetical protein
MEYINNADGGFCFQCELCFEDIFYCLTFFSSLNIISRRVQMNKRSLSVIHELVVSCLVSWKWEGSLIWSYKSEVWSNGNRFYGYLKGHVSSLNGISMEIRLMEWQQSVEVSFFETIQNKSLTSFISGLAVKRVGLRSNKKESFVNIVIKCRWTPLMRLFSLWHRRFNHIKSPRDMCHLLTLSRSSFSTFSFAFKSLSR